MGRIDNDETKGLALPFVILAHVRCGGTFCAHALSNHPLIHCDRGETVHHLSVWRKAGIKPGMILKLMWDQTGYRAAGLRLIYRQAFHRRVWPAIQEIQPHIIHLTRRGLIRQALSYGYQQEVRSGGVPYHPVHSFKTRRPPAQVMDPRAAVRYVQSVDRERKRGQQTVDLYDGPALEVLYEDMVGWTTVTALKMAPTVSEAICAFLNVPAEPLRVDLRRDFPISTPDMFANWPEIERALRKAGYGPDVDYELMGGRDVRGPGGADG